jgi:hypothetical protein
MLVAVEQKGRICQCCQDEQAMLFTAGHWSGSGTEAGQLKICSECFAKLAELFDDVVGQDLDRKEYQGI